MTHYPQPPDEEPSDTAWNLSPARGRSLVGLPVGLASLQKLVWQLSPRSLLAIFGMLVLLVGLPLAVADVTGERLFADLRDHSLDEFSLIEAAMMIGGADLQTAAIVDRQFLVAVKSQVPMESSTWARVTAIHALMFNELLTGEYHVAASQLTDALETGNFNCVSATTLFLALADMCQVPARAVLLPGHMRCRVWIQEQQRWIDVEPTKQHGFWDDDIALRGRELTRVQMLAKLYYNRGIELLRDRDYWTALRCARVGWDLDPEHGAAQESIAAVYGNWSLSLCQNQRFGEAARLLAEARSEFPTDDQLANSEVHVYVLWMEHFANTGDWAAARMRLADALTRHPDAAVLQELQRLWATAKH